MSGTKTIDSDAVSQLFTEARTHNAWIKEPVSDQLLKELYERTKMGPTSMNAQPLRIVFLKSQEAKEKLLPALAPGNVQKTMDAPVTAILATDTQFYENMPIVFPHFPGAKDLFLSDAAMAEVTGFRNSSMQIGYFILAARSLGLDVGPLSGFSNEKVDATFFPDGRLRSNIICNLGYGDATKLFPRGPRLSFDEAAKII